MTSAPRDDDDEPSAESADASSPAARSPQRALFAARTRGRELALKYLYQLDLRRDDASGFEEFAVFEDERGMAVDFARRLIQGVIARKATIDEGLKSVAKNWSLHRMAAVDRNILRLGACEMTMADPSPPGVAINEAVELGKKYGARQSGKFINGVLDKLSRSPGFLPATPAGPAAAPEA
jgi:N utilization substance protein B